MFGAPLLASTALWAQHKADILGTVTDSSGAVIRNAKVVVSNPDKGFYCDMKSNMLALRENSATPTLPDGGSADLYKAFLPYFETTESIGLHTAVSNYNSLQLNFRHTFGRGLNFQVAYRWSHDIDDSISTYSSSANGVDPFNLTRWYGTSDLNRTQVLGMSYVYELPIFKNSTNGALNSVAGGRKIRGIISLWTGQPITFNCGVSGTSSAIGSGVMCSTPGRVRIKKRTVNDLQYRPTPTWFDPAMLARALFSQLFANGQSGMFDYMGRNVLTAPGRNTWDLALLKDFQLSWVHAEHSTLQFRWETFNTFNHPQLKSINASCSSSTGFGEPCTQQGNAEVTGDWGPRVMQFALKFSF